jgi:uncharacterized protein (UPF0335 family)
MERQGSVMSEAAFAALAESVLARAKTDERQGDIEDQVGHVPANTRKVAGIAVDRLRSLVERIERMEEEKKALGSDIRDIYAEAKSAGFDVRVLRQLIRLRRQEPNEVEEQESLLDVYKRALGM